MFLPGLLLVALVLISACATDKEYNARPNVLLLYMDDLLPQLGCCVQC